ncbi:EspG domain-containing protein, partial [Escherichia coli]|uniref:EspG domain-containing protein n=1 Tax=Escherichia coli TaxID=562 RepID=UPI00257264AC
INAGHEITSKARIIHQIQLIRGITNISISQSPDGSIHVASHTGILIMAPEDRPNELGMLTNRTSYEVPQGVKCEIDEMVRTLQPRYGASETYLKNI